MSQEKDKKRLRFKYEDDIVLREIVSRNPFESGYGWEEVKNSLLQLTKKNFSVKTIQQHIQMLLEQWENKDKNNIKSSGVEEPYSEKDILLQELHDLLRDVKREKQNKKIATEKKKAQTDIGKETRECAAVNYINEHDYIIEEPHVVESHVFIENCGEEPEDFNGVDEALKENENLELEPPLEPPENVDSVVTEKASGKSTPKVRTSGNKTLDNSRNILGPIRNRAKRTNYMRRSGLDYLKEKHEKEMELEEKKLKIEERKVAVSERNITLAERKFLLESEQYKNIFDGQQELISKLLAMVEKYN